MEAPLDGRNKISDYPRGVIEPSAACGSEQDATHTGAWRSTPGLWNYKKNILSSKVASSESFRKYLTSFSHFAPALFSFFGQRPIRAMRFQGYRQRQMFDKKIVQSIPKGTVIALGDASVTSRFGHVEPTPNKRMAKLLRANFTVYDVDEFNTSKLCSGCHQELDKPCFPRGQGRRKRRG